jgi:hypothetical protein
MFFETPKEIIKLCYVNCLTRTLDSRKVLNNLQTE